MTEPRPRDPTTGGGPYAHRMVAAQLFDGGRYDLAERELRKHLEGIPEDPVALALLARSIAQLGRADEALEVAREAVRLAPDLARSHAALAHALATAGRHREAVASDREALRLSSDDPMRHSDLAHDLTMIGHAREALAVAEAGLRLDAQNIACLNERGLALLGLRRIAEARETIRSAIVGRPESSVLHANLGVGLLHQGFVTDARAELLEALRLDASNEIARYHVGFAEDFGGFTQSHFLRVGTWWWRRTGRERLAVVVTFALGAIVWPGFVITALVLATIETSSSLRRRLRAKRGPQDPVTQKLDRMLNVSYTVALFGPILVMVLTGHQEWVMGAGLGVLLSLVIAVAHPTGPRHWIAFSLAVVLGILGVLTRPLALSPLVVNLLGLASVLLYLPTQFGSAGKGQPGAED